MSKANLNGKTNSSVKLSGYFICDFKLHMYVLHQSTEKPQVHEGGLWCQCLSYL